ncbi:MAG: hypothetical protein J1E02_05170, partial [Coprobacter sp.]|nr:hypothetical protein [Coprobacter sp.]
NDLLIFSWDSCVSRHVPTFRVRPSDGSRHGPYISGSAFGHVTTCPYILGSAFGRVTTCPYISGSTFRTGHDMALQGSDSGHVTTCPYKVRFSGCVTTWPY